MQILGISRSAAYKLFRQFNNIAISFKAGFFPVSVNGDSTNNPGKKSKKIILWIARWYSFPSFHICIIFTLLHRTCISDYFIRNITEFWAILICCIFNCILITIKIQLNDFFVFQIFTFFPTVFSRSLIISYFRWCWLHL